MTENQHTFRDAIRETVPQWLRGTHGERLLYAIAIHLDLLGDAVVAAVKYRYPMLYGPGSLPYLGRMRRIRRGRTEPDTTYGIRLRGWLDAHAHRGSPGETLRQMWAYYTPQDPIYDGGFATADPTDFWTEGSDATFSTVAETPLHSNVAQCAKLTIAIGDALGTLTQSSLVVGTTYTFGIWVHGDGTNGAPRVVVGGTTFNGTTDAGWQRITGEVLAADTDVVLTVVGNAATEDFAVFGELEFNTGPGSAPRFTISEVNYHGLRFTIYPDGSIAKDLISWDPDPAGSASWPRYWLFLHWPWDVQGDGLWEDPGAWDDGGVWDSELSVQQVRDILEIPEAWNSGHVRNAYVVLLSGDRELWDYPAGTWDELGDWADEGPAILSVVQS